MREESTVEVMRVEGVIVGDNGPHGLVAQPTWMATEQLAYAERMREKAVEYRRLADRYDDLANGASRKVIMVMPAAR